jgi:phosphinothricin acetyltransferase
VVCTYDSHAGAILEIFNEAIANSTALYDYKLRTPESMLGWFRTKDAGRFPVVGVVEDGQLLGLQAW